MKLSYPRGTAATKNQKKKSLITAVKNHGTRKKTSTQNRHSRLLLIGRWIRENPTYKPQLRKCDAKRKKRKTPAAKPFSPHKCKSVGSGESTTLKTPPKRFLLLLSWRTCVGPPNNGRHRFSVQTPTPADDNKNPCTFFAWGVGEGRKGKGGGGGGAEELSGPRTPFKYSLRPASLRLVYALMPHSAAHEVPQHPQPPPRVSTKFLHQISRHNVYFSFFFILLAS